jgi:hypothetical protein
MTVYAAMSNPTSSAVIITLGTLAFLTSTLEIALDLVVIQHQIDVIESHN